MNADLTRKSLLLMRWNVSVSSTLRHLACIAGVVGFLVPAASAQITGMEVRVDSVHYDTYSDGVNLEGFITYHVDLICTNPADEISAVYGTAAEGPYQITTSGTLFQHELAGWTAEELADVFIPTFPSMEFDSFVTIGKLNTNEPGNFQSAIATPGPATVIDTFEGPTNGDYYDGGALFIEDGLIFTLFGAANAQCGTDLRITVAQITTDAGGVDDPDGTTDAFEVELCTQIFVNGVQGDIQNDCFEVQAVNPCTDDPLDPLVIVVDTALCAGQLPVIQVGDSMAGNDPVTYELFADGVWQENQIGDPVFDDLLPDVEYFWALTDAAGCRDTSDIYTYSVAEAITFQAQVDEFVECASDTSGVISYTYSGGEGPYVITANGTDTLSLSGLETEVPCGLYNLLITDVHGCTAGQTLDIPCPDGVEFDIQTTDILCSADCDGAMTATATGGTGNLDVVLYDILDPANPLDSQNGPSGTSVSATGICAGSYVLSATDEAGCISLDTLFFDAPNPLILTVDSVADILCGGNCTGQAFVTLSGGTGAVSLTLDDVPITTYDLEALCETEGSLLCAIDQNNCQACDSLTVVENPPLEILTTVDNATCIGQADGSIDYFVSGGLGPIEFWVSPFGTNLDALEGGTYTFTATDSLGCSLEQQVEVGYDVETDLELDLLITPVSCFDEQDGIMQAVIAGGTAPFTIEWSDPNATTGELVTGLAAGNYFVSVEDSQGCVVDSSAVMSVNPDCIFIATALTPNGDGYNDEWFIGGMEFHPSADVQVYNRWGQLIFSEQGYQEPWNGRYNGSELPIGDYYYYIDLKNGQPAFTGTVTIKY